MSQSSSVRDIEDSIVRFGVFTMSSSNLDVVFIGNFLHLSFVFHQLKKFDMNRGSKTSSQIGWARGDVTEMLAVGEFGFFLNTFASSLELREDTLDIGSFVHGDDSELIFLVAPDVEGVVFVHEDTSS